MARDTRRFAVLEIYGIVQQLVILMEFVVDNNHGTGLKKLTKTTAIDLIHKMAIEAVNWRLAHNPYGSYEKAIMQSLFGEREKDYSKKEKQIYNALSSDPQWLTIVNEIERQISEHIEVDTYKDWKVVKTGGLIGLAEGQDFRITEYYRLHPDQKDNEEAVITLKASNPINYLLGQFNKQFGERLIFLMNQQPFHFQQQYRHEIQPIQHENKLTEMRLQALQRHSQEMVKSDPEAIQSHLRWVYENTEQYVTSMFLDTLVTMYPMIERDPMVPMFNPLGLAQLGVWNVEKFREEYLQRMVSAFGFSYFTTYLKKDKKYKLEFYQGSNVLAVYEAPIKDVTEAEMHELVRSYIAGDRLPVHEARKAQELYEEMARQGVIQ